MTIWNPPAYAEYNFIWRWIVRDSVASRNNGSVAHEREWKANRHLRVKWKWCHTKHVRRKRWKFWIFWAVRIHEQHASWYPWNTWIKGLLQQFLFFSQRWCNCLTGSRMPCQQERVLCVTLDCGGNMEVKGYGGHLGYKLVDHKGHQFGGTFIFCWKLICGLMISYLYYFNSIYISPNLN